jgi:hypothetical protein
MIQTTLIANAELGLSGIASAIYSRIRSSAPHIRLSQALVVIALFLHADGSSAAKPRSGMQNAMYDARYF